VITDAAGQPTSITYNTAGQPLTVTNAKGETTTYGYSNGYLQSVTRAGATVSLTYDAFGRVRTVTQPDGYAVTTDYDGLNRVTKTAYPDGTFEQYTYQHLDLATERDRLGRITRHYYDRARRRTSTRDPLGRVTQLAWCGCGQLKALIDGNGRRTSWEPDAQGRVVREVRADGVTDTTYTYDLRGRLKTITDPKAQTTTYACFADDRVASVTYTNAAVSTPSVSFTYDAAYPRVTAMADGTGTTAYTYIGVGSLGAMRTATIDGPRSHDTISYGYDELGRVVSRAINGAARTHVYDALGRVTSATNALGTFGYTYVGVTGRLQTVTAPNNQTTTYSYFGHANDDRLQTILHRRPDGSTLSRFDYTYDAGQRITSWTHQADTDPATMYTFGYDAADQLVRATKQTAGGTPTVLKRYAYGYDAGGNRTAEQIDDALTGASYDALNRLVSQQASGALTVAGGLNEAGTVTVAGRPVTLTAAHQFSAAVPVAAGTTVVTIAAVDASGNAASRQYELNVGGSGRSFTYDANGNLTGDGSRTFEWDALNRLVAVNNGTKRSELPTTA
jgi:YD repeat-containing protein